MSYILDENNNKIMHTVEYIETDEWYKHKEGIYINNDGHLDTEDRHLTIKEAIQENHAVCKKQLDEVKNSKYSKEEVDNKISAIQNLINITIQNIIKTQESKILTQMLNFRNEQIKNRIQRKYITIPKTPYQFIKLFDHNDIGDNSIDLRSVIILNVWIKRFDRYHHAKSSLVEAGFSNSLEFFYNAEMTEYHTYFSTAPSNWNMSSIIEWLRIPQPISIDNENIPESKHENNE